MRWLRVALNRTPLGEQVAACGEVRRTLANAYRYRCGQPACLWCRRRYVQWKADELATRFEDVIHDRLVWFTITASPTAQLPDVFSAFASLRQAVRNAARDPRLAGLRAYGALTPDPLPAELADGAKLTIPKDHPVWRPSLHGILELPHGVARQDFERVLVASPRLQLEVRTGPFDKGIDVQVQIAAHVGRPFAAYASTPVRNGPVAAFCWPLDWASAFFCGLHGVGGGFRQIRRSQHRL